ncbi:MAG: phosphoglucosamine mutase [Bacteroidetes bacterium]|nr:phosphoglucosamine mutase [Bacteroidota bacterium]
MEKIKLKPIKSVSGIRGIIENKGTDSLTFEEIEKIIISYIHLFKLNNQNKKILIGRDGRNSGIKILDWITSILIDYGIDVINIDLTTTPTLALSCKQFDGGIMITASHNPEKWNGIKLFINGIGLSKKHWNKIINSSPTLTKSNIKGNCLINDYKKYIQSHINKILELDIIDRKAIKSKDWKVVIDGTNSTGGIALQMLFENLGIREIKNINSEINESFNRNPEPIEQNLSEICKIVKEGSFDIGFATDPDADRLAIIDEKGKPWGEELTLITSADYVLQNKLGNTVSNLSSSSILKKITQNYNCQYYSSAVGESNVIEKMKEVNAIIGGEGNGGVIYPKLNYCRDSLIASALILSYLSQSNLSASELKNKYLKTYFIKKKINLNDKIDLDEIILRLKTEFKNKKINLEDGLKIDFENLWIHIRKSNTEPIIRICSEGFHFEELQEMIIKIENIISTI